MWLILYLNLQNHKTTNLFTSYLPCMIVLLSLSWYRTDECSYDIVWSSQKSRSDSTSSVFLFPAKYHIKIHEHMEIQQELCSCCLHNSCRIHKVQGFVEMFLLLHVFYLILFLFSSFNTWGEPRSNELFEI